MCARKHLMIIVLTTFHRAISIFNLCIKNLYLLHLHELNWVSELQISFTRSLQTTGIALWSMYTLEMFKLALVHQLWDEIKLVLTQVSKENGIVSRKPWDMFVGKDKTFGNWAWGSKSNLKYRSMLVCWVFWAFFICKKG